MQKKNVKWIKVVLIILAVAVCCFVGYRLYQRGEEMPERSQEEVNAETKEELDPYLQCIGCSRAYIEEHKNWNTDQHPQLFLMGLQGEMDYETETDETLEEYELTYDNAPVTAIYWDYVAKQQEGDTLKLRNLVADLNKYYGKEGEKMKFYDWLGARDHCSDEAYLWYDTENDLNVIAGQSAAGLLFVRWRPADLELDGREDESLYQLDQDDDEEEKEEDESDETSSRRRRTRPYYPDAREYSDADEFYYWNSDDFIDYEDAEGYYNENQ